MGEWFSGLPAGWTSLKENAVDKKVFGQMFPEAASKARYLCKCCLVVDIVFDCQGNSKVPVISLFSGCGGLELGLSRSET